MIKVIWVMVGGAVGSVLRIIIRDWSAAIPGDFPWGTFGVNILGAFLLGFFVTITVEVTRIRSHYRAGIAEGFLGGFTTFSTFMYEGVALIKDNETKNALLYVTLTMVLGIGAFAIGWLTRLYL